MLMKMSFDPRWIARSRSWWTSWKSRVASAVLITNVGVASTCHSGRESPIRTGPPAGHRQLVVDLGEHDLDPLPDTGFTVELAQHPHALVQFDQGDDERGLLAGHLRVVVHDVAVDHAVALRDEVLRFGGTAFRAHRAWWVAEQAAAAASLDAQLSLPGAFPEVLGVAVDGRP